MPSLSYALAAVLIAVPCVAQTAPGTVTTLYTFAGPPDGANPSAGVVAGSDGLLYGTTVNGGLQPASEPYSPYGCGLVFSLAPPPTPGGPWTETVLHIFAGGDDGCGPSGVTIGSGGVLYGTTSNSVSGPTAFSLTPSAVVDGVWTETIIHRFAGCPTDAGAPLFGLVVGEGGVLYGAGFYGGNISCIPTDNGAGEGAIFALTPPKSPGGDWTESMVFSIGDLDDGPSAGLTIGRNGVIYGVTRYGGGPFGGPGTVFSLAPPDSPGGVWTQTVLSNFSSSDGKNNGSTPVMPVAVGPGGTIYGTTSGGGVGGGGEAYALTPPASAGTWTYTVLRDFSSTKGNAVGSGPEQLTLALGAIFSASAQGGASHAGTVFALTPGAPGQPWRERIVHTFNGSDGIAPNGALVIGPNGLLYGTTVGRQPVEQGGGPRYGTIYSLQP